MASKMTKIFLFLISFMIFSFFPNMASADCADLGHFTSWVREGEHAIVFYMGNVPLARLNIPYCEIYPFSAIRLIKSYVCDSDSILVDGETCSIMTVNELY
jgi:hypothetical protein